MIYSVNDPKYRSFLSSAKLTRRVPGASRQQETVMQTIESRQFDLIRSDGSDRSPSDPSIVRWSSHPGHNLIASATITIGTETSPGYQSITYKPCKHCGEIVSVRDVARGYPTMTQNDVCDKCCVARLELLQLRFSSETDQPAADKICKRCGIRLLMYNTAKDCQDDVCNLCHLCHLSRQLSAKPRTNGYNALQGLNE